ncbi:MAG: enoyl-CoA hydratase-related protein, partial [Caulobacterales bacterium]
MTETLDFDKVQIAFEDGLAILTLNDPDRLNAITPNMGLGISAALMEVAKPRRGVRALMLTGAGRGFCAGVNLAGQAKAAEVASNLPALGAVESLFHPLVRKLRDVRVPIVSAVNGPCVGIGLVFALLSDYVIASEDAYFLVPFRNLASSTDSGLSWLLTRTIGPVRARQMILRAERVPAARAVEWGLANVAVAKDVFAAEARAVSDEFAQGPTVALARMRRL